MSVRLLCIGDIHIGRKIRLPDLVTNPEFGAALVDMAALQPGSAWLDAVDNAIALQVDGVVLAGDVIDGNAHFYQALNLLEQGINRLVAARIQVIAVAGNHDVEILPRLADEISDFRLLGRGGTWETCTITGKSGSSLQIRGWSFPSASIPFSPLTKLEQQAQSNAASASPLIGLLHCCLDCGLSSHAPVSDTEFGNVDGAAWLLGHIHKPDPMDEPRPIGYLGSLVGLDPTETGWHGAWLLSCDDSRVEMQRLDSSPLQWSASALNISGIRSMDDLDSAVAGALRKIHQSSPPGCIVIGCRLRLTGRSPISAEIRKFADRHTANPSITYGAAPVCFLDAVAASEVIPELNIEAVASGVGPPAVLAGMILNVMNGTEEGLRLVREATEELERTSSSSTWRDISTPTLTPKFVSETLIDAGLTTLEMMLKGDRAQSEQQAVAISQTEGASQ